MTTAEPQDISQAPGLAAPQKAVTPDGVATVEERLWYHLIHSVGRDKWTATPRDWFVAAAHALRDPIIEGWMKTNDDYAARDVKRVYYLSMEFLIGRTLTNALINMGVYDLFRAAMVHVGCDFDEVQSWEADAALGNGGLGRLAACFLESMATLGIPGFGYGIRYEYGMFTQHVEHGWQVEAPENWLRYGNPWEFPRPSILYPVRFGGHVVHYKDGSGIRRAQWMDAEEVMALAHDVPVPGYGGKVVNNLRLWAAKSTREFDLRFFNQGNYIESVKEKNESENLSKVLYPSDSTAQGKELRFKQEYFFVAASLQDIIHRFLEQHGDFGSLPDYVAIQLNDTHPTLAIPELMRLLVDDYLIEWHKAWDITKQTFAYTNHTLLPEALETWPLDLVARLLPRHLEIIFEINHHFLNEVRHRWPGDNEVTRRMSLVTEEGEKRLRMAHLAVVGSHRVNGVAAIHTELMKSTIFGDFERWEPGKIVNMTNGITPRRWLLAANPELASLVSEKIGSDWVTHLDHLEALAPFANDAEFRQRFLEVKRRNKGRLAKLIRDRNGVTLSVEPMYDVMVKRMHEYKRQLLNLLHVVTRYRRIRANPGADIVPRVVVIGGKAAPGYAMAKLILKLINDVADVVNNDPLVGDRLKLVFIQNYNVSTAEVIIPAADLSEQISTAGTEASGTGNMKLALNGALTVGTWDGANIEISQEVGEDNLFLFGLKAHEVARIRREGYDARAAIEAQPELAAVLEMIGSGYFSPDQRDRFQPILDVFFQGDHYLLSADYPHFLVAQEKADLLFRDPEDWARRAILNVARMGKFSSDRTVADYGRDIWGV